MENLPTSAAGAHASPVVSVTASNEVQQAVHLKKQLVAKVTEDPEGASRLIQNWVRESERKA